MAESSSRLLISSSFGLVLQFLPPSKRIPLQQLSKRFYKKLIPQSLINQRFFTKPQLFEFYTISHGNQIRVSTCIESQQDQLLVIEDRYLQLQ